MKNPELLPLGLDRPQALESASVPPWNLRGLQLGLRALGSVYPRLAAHVSLKLYATPSRKAPREAELEILQSCERITLRFEGKKLKGYSMGKGPVILLVHGWSDCAATLAHFMPAISELGFRAVAFDGPAHGESQGQQTDILEYGRYIKRAVEHLGDVHAIVAHSFGGSALLMLLNDQPGLPVEKIVTIGSPAQFDNTLMHFTRRMGLTPPVTLEFENLIETRLQRKLSHIRVDGSRGLVPTLIVHDKEDRVVPFQEARKLESAWSHGELLATQGLGHLRILRAPEIITQVVNFLVRP